MNLITEHDVQLDDNRLPEVQEQLLLKSPNAMSAFLYDTSELKKLPDSKYLRAFKGSQFIGAVHVEENPFNNIVSLHPMLIDRNRELFAEVTEAAILWCINKSLEPTARVLWALKYTYMHKFLVGLGMMQCPVENGFRLYRLPMNWKPKSFTSYTFDWS